MPVSIPIAVLALGVLPLSAQGADIFGQGGLGGFGQRAVMGVQGFLISPQDDLRAAVNSRPGFELGVHWSIELPDMIPGTEIRPRISYSRFDGGAFHASSLDSTTTAQGVIVGADFLWYLDPAHRGLYGVAGADITWWSTSYRFAGNDRQTSPGALIGVGQRFTRQVAVELDLSTGRFRPSVGSASQVKLGVLYKF